MSIRCPKCRMLHDVAQFQIGAKLKCRCGFMLDSSLIDTAEDFLRYCESEEEQKKAKEIQRDAQAVCRMILDEEHSKVDIQITMANLKEKVKRLFPDKVETFEMIYGARFRRLWDQFRGSDNALD